MYQHKIVDLTKYFVYMQNKNNILKPNYYCTSNKQIRSDIKSKKKKNNNKFLFLAKQFYKMCKCYCIHVLFYISDKMPALYNSRRNHILYNHIFFYNKQKYKNVFYIYICFFHEFIVI